MSKNNNVKNVFKKEKKHEDEIGYTATEEKSHKIWQK